MDMINHNILCIDLKSFYASVECIDRGLNPFTIPLVVADKERGGGSIILAVSPYLRSLGVPSRLRIFELPTEKDIVFAKPRMKRYLEISAKVVNIYLDYVGQDDLHIYSIDECFLDVTYYLKYFNCTTYELAKRIKKRIYDELGLTCTVGIGPNMLLAKLAMDIESKHTKEQIAVWDYKDVETKLWPVTPLSKMWGIGSRMEKRLNALGMYKIGDIAHYPKKLLIDEFGIIGGQLHDHVNGIDNTDIREKYIPEKESLTSGQVFFRDYSYKELPVIIREMLDDLVLRMVYQHKVCKNVALYIGYSKTSIKGFSHQMQLDNYTDDLDDLYEGVMAIFNKYIADHPIRTISIVLSQIERVKFYQPNLLKDPLIQEKKRKLFYTMARIKEKYGNNSVLRATSKLEESNIRERHNLIGGHRK